MRLSPASLSAAAVLLLTACGGDGGSTAPATLTPQANATWSSWRVVPTRAVALPAMPTTDTTGYTPKAVLATRNIVDWWNAPASGVRNRTFWWVAATTADIPLKGTYARGLWVSDDGQPNSDPSLISVLTSTAYRTGSFDDDALAWSLTGPTVAGSGSVSGQHLTLWPAPYVPQPCLGQDQAPYVTHTISFVMNGNTATGTITYDFRAIRASCSRPRAIVNRWQLVVPFTATRLK